MMSSKNVGIAVTGGAVAPAILNSVVTSAARSVRLNGGLPFIIDGGYSALLTRKSEAIFEITSEMIDRWQDQTRTEFVGDRSLVQRSENELKDILEVLKGQGISRMIVVGGNGSSFALSALSQFAPNYFSHLVQILKTMDGDCQSPFWNLGFASTLHHAKDMLGRYSNELSIYGSPFVVKVLGREVGQLAFHLGLDVPEENKGLILIREEFGDRKLTTQQLTKLLVGSALKKLSLQASFGPLVVSEGLIDCLKPESQKDFGVTFHEDGRTNFVDAKLEGILKVQVSRMMQELEISPFGVPLQIGERIIGYGARAGDPISRDLKLAVEYGIRAGHLATLDKALPYPTLIRRNDDIDLRSIINKKGEAAQCWVDTSDEIYQQFLENQHRLYPEDLRDELSLARISKCTNLPAHKFKRMFTETANIFSALRKR